MAAEVSPDLGWRPYRWAEAGHLQVLGPAFPTLCPLTPLLCLVTAEGLR